MQEGAFLSHIELWVKRRDGMRQDIFEQYRAYLPGMTVECPEVFGKLAHIFQEQVLELWPGPEGTYYAAYLMNDAAEAVLVFRDSVLTGVFEKDIRGEVSAELAIEKDHYMLVVHQGERNCFTLRFRELSFEVKRYPYHEIAHVWVNGQEHWRQILYQLAIVRDKKCYLGEAFCQEEELFLLPLLEFAPLRSFYFVPWEAQTVFETDAQGGARFLEILQKVNDPLLYARTKQYLKCCNTRRGRRKGRQLHALLNQQEHRGVYDFIREMLDQASDRNAQTRTFGALADGLLEKKRVAIQRMFADQGFHGTYPWFFKSEHGMDSSCRIYEELPFVCGGEKKCRFYYFWSEVDHWQKCGQEILPLEGFFEGIGRKYEIQVEGMDWEKEKI